jgi:hypothetical protein
MTTNWKIAQLKRNPSNGLVFEVTFIMNFELEEETDRHVGSVELVGDETLPTFVPYEELTEAIVLDWVKEELTQAKITEIEANMKARLEERIEKKINPEFLVGKPWEKA